MKPNQAAIELKIGRGHRALVVTVPPCTETTVYPFQLSVEAACDLVFRLMEDVKVARAVAEQSRRTLAQQREFDAEFLRAAGVTDAD
jgi:hypothetical protein